MGIVVGKRPHVAPAGDAVHQQVIPQDAVVPVGGVVVVERLHAHAAGVRQQRIREQLQVVPVVHAAFFISGVVEISRVVDDGDAAGLFRLGDGGLVVLFLAQVALSPAAEVAVHMVFAHHKGVHLNALLHVQHGAAVPVRAGGDLLVALVVHGVDLVGLEDAVEADHGDHLRLYVPALAHHAVVRDGEDVVALGVVFLHHVGDVHLAVAVKRMGVQLGAVVVPAVPVHRFIGVRDHVIHLRGAGKGAHTEQHRRRQQQGDRAVASFHFPSSDPFGIFSVYQQRRTNARKKRKTVGNENGDLFHNVARRLAPFIEGKQHI